MRVSAAALLALAASAAAWNNDVTETVVETTTECPMSSSVRYPVMRFIQLLIEYPGARRLHVDPHHHFLHRQVRLVVYFQLYLPCRLG